MSVYNRHKQVVIVNEQEPLSISANYHDAVVQALLGHRMQLDTALSRLATHTRGLANAAKLLIETLHSQHKVLIAGNGGSAAEAQHFAAELVGRFKRERMPYPVLALTSDTAILTAVANDYGYQEVFARQIRAFGQPGDLFIAFSTSGESENLIRAALAARQCQMMVIAITGTRTSRLGRHSDITVHVPLVDGAVMQELHMVIIHVLCDIAEAQLAVCEREENVSDQGDVFDGGEHLL